MRRSKARMVEFGDILTAINIAITIVLTWVTYQLNRRVDKFSRRYTNSVQRLERLRTVLTSANELITMAAHEGAVHNNVEARAKGFGQYIAVMVEVDGIAQVVGGDIFQIISRCDSLNFFEDDETHRPGDETQFSDKFSNAAKDFRTIAREAFAAIEHQLEKEVDNL